MNMFCRQCEQTSGGKKCSVHGVCGKNPETAILQDLLVHALTGIAVYGHKARQYGISDLAVDRFIAEGLFTTVTNVNFDPARIEQNILEAFRMKEGIKQLFLRAYREKEGREFSGVLPDAADWIPADTHEGMLEQGRRAGIMADPDLNEDIRSLREIFLYGLKGMAAYADHAAILGVTDERVNAFFHRGLIALTDDTLDTDALVGLIMEFGKINLKCLEILDGAHTSRFGDPVPTKVFLGAKKGPAIAVSGHDLYDMERLLEQTAGKGVNVYTHGEMLPAHGYPELKKHPHFVGHYGGAWQNQQKEFDAFPGAILMTTNCLQKPRDGYRDRIFTTGLVGWPGVAHVHEKNGGKDFSGVIAKALELGGYLADVPGREILTGFGHKAVLSSAGVVVDAVRKGAIRHFFLIGGCDGAKPGRNYYTEFSQKVPADCVILTLACGKFRFNTLDFGSIAGLPRLLDCGQCNDSYSAIVIASALADAFKCGINDLPLSLILSWYEQKAVCILLTLLSLGVKNMRLGPTLPAFVSPNVLKVLAEKFNLMPVTTPDRDLKSILG